uniref:Ubiquitin thioesterase n=1 Tax=Timema shepardi TaxID=629360 RepID=A0A7R9B1I9_TIMSH|nr:unnamed protein product [Timema shepardi]
MANEAPVTTKYDPGVNQDELIMQQQRQIEKEIYDLSLKVFVNPGVLWDGQISDSIDLVGDMEPISSLEGEYASDEIFHQKVQDLSRKYKSMRRTRPDGNCFFRGFSYAYLEYLLKNKEEYKRFHELASKSKDDLVTMGFPKFTVEDFHDTLANALVVLSCSTAEDGEIEVRISFMEVVKKVGESPDNFSQRELHDLFNQQSYSDYVVVYLRLITSGQLQRDSEFYQNFIDGKRTVLEFCHQSANAPVVLSSTAEDGEIEVRISEVEPMYKESDHIHIIALSTALNVGIRVRYMDRGESSEVIAHDFPEGSTCAVHLLYRPGHYDILYP